MTYKQVLCENSCGAFVSFGCLATINANGNGVSKNTNNNISVK
jgi:hypothetical protein